MGVESTSIWWSEFYSDWSISWGLLNPGVGLWIFTKTTSLSIHWWTRAQFAKCGGSKCSICLWCVPYRMIQFGEQKYCLLVLIMSIWQKFNRTAITNQAPVLFLRCKATILWTIPAKSVFNDWFPGADWNSANRDGEIHHEANQASDNIVMAGIYYISGLQLRI